MQCVVNKPAQVTATLGQHHCTEIVHQKGDAREIATMLNVRLAKGWALDRIIDHMLPDNSFGGHIRTSLVIYYFKRI